MFFYCLNIGYCADEVCEVVLLPLPFLILFSISFLMQLNFLSAAQQQLLINQNLQHRLILVPYTANSTIPEHSASGRLEIDLGYLVHHTRGVAGLSAPYAINSVPAISKEYWTSVFLLPVPSFSSCAIFLS